MSTDLLARPDVRELTEETNAIVTQAQSLKIVTNVSYQLAGEELQRIKGALKRLDDVRKAITQPMDAAKKVVMEFFRAPTEKLELAERQIKKEMQSYTIELARKEEEARQAAEQAANDERERIALAAAKAAEEGRHDDADAIAAQVVNVVAAPVVIRQAPKVAGISTTKVWKFEVTDAALVPREYCIVDEKKVRGVVTALKENAVIPGVRIWSEDQISSRAASF